MDYKFSDRISLLQPSAIREILKVTADPTVISFAAGNPSADTFPTEMLAELSASIFAKQSSMALQYGVTEGYEPLRVKTAQRLREKYGVGKEFDNLIIVSGAQQGIELTAKVLCNEGDIVLCEDPSFIGALNALRSYNLRLAGVPCDENGMDTDKLERLLQTTAKGAKLLYTIPTFQNPSGTTLSAPRRKKLLELAEKYDFIILEDSPYHELRFEGQYIPPIKAGDENGRVIYCGSYSKIIAPGIRLGFVCAPSPIIQKLTVAKQVSDVHSTMFFQMLVSDFLSAVDLDAHIDNAVKIYRAKRDTMIKGLTEHCGEQLRWRTPEGGIFLWCELADGSNGFELCRKAGLKKVAAVPGSSFMTDEKAVTNTIRLNYSLPTLEQISLGVVRLGEVFKN